MQLSAGHGVSAWLVRVAVLLALAATIAYPVRGFWSLPALPLLVKLIWAILLAVAFAAPRQSLLLFLIGAPLLPTLPSMLRWPNISLVEMWLMALLIPFWCRLLTRPSATRVPSAAIALALLATASAIVALYPLHLAFESLPQWLGSLDEYARSDLLTSLSQRHVYSALLAWLVLLEGLALLWLLLDSFAGASDDDLHEMAVAMAVGCAAVSAFGLYQWWTGKFLLAFWRELDPFLVRINGTFGDVNALGSYLASTLPLMIALGVLARSQERRLIWMAIAAACAAATLFTGSRAAWAAVVLAGAAWAALMARGQVAPDRLTRARFRRVVALSSVTMVAIVVVLAAMGTARNSRPEQVRSYKDAVLYTFNLRLPMEERLKGRTALWRAAGRMVAQHPLTGVGIGRYFKDVASYTPEGTQLIRPQENAHNYFLQIGAELGFPGVLLLAGLIALPLWTMSRITARTTSPTRRIIALGAGAGVLAHVLTWLTGHPLLVREGHLTFWPLVALVLLAAPPTAVENWRWQWPRWALLATAVGVLVSVPMRAASEVRGVDLSKSPYGLHEPERDPRGQTFRWTGDHVILYVPTSARTFEFSLRSLAPFAQSVVVLRNGAQVDRLEFTDHEWHPYRYQLSMASGSSRRYHRFDLRISPTWVPPGDGRALGVALGPMEWK